MFAPLSSNALSELLDPFAAATCKAEYPPRISPFGPFTHAPSRMSNLTIWPCPACDATCSGVHSSLFFTFTSTPGVSHNKSTTSISSARAASCNAVSPLSSAKVTSAPCAIKIRHTSACPQLAAVIKPVTPLSPRSLASAPIFNNPSTTSSSPSSHAFNNGVAKSCCARTRNGKGNHTTVSHRHRRRHRST